MYNIHQSQDTIGMTGEKLKCKTLLDNTDWNELLEQFVEKWILQIVKLKNSNAIYYILPSCTCSIDEFVDYTQMHCIVLAFDTQIKHIVGFL